MVFYYLNHRLFRNLVDLSFIGPESKYYQGLSPNALCGSRVESTRRHRQQNWEENIKLGQERKKVESKQIGKSSTERERERMSYLLPHLHSGWAVDQSILAEEERLVVIRFGHDWDETCMQVCQTFLPLLSLYFDLELDYMFLIRFVVHSSRFGSFRTGKLRYFVVIV